MPRRQATLLLAFDGSAGASAATRVAAGLFPAARAVVLTVHSAPRIREETARAAATVGVEADRFAALSREAEQEALATAGQGSALAGALGLAPEPETASATAPALAIIAAAERVGADVVVCGSRGLSALSRATLGSTSSALLHRADRPLLVVPEATHPSSAGPIVIGYDGSDAAEAAIASAARLWPGRRAIVVNVWESPIRHTLSGHVLLHSPLRKLTAELDDCFAEAARETAGRGAAIGREHGLAAQAREVEAEAREWHGLLETASAADAAVVVIGSRGRGGVSSALLGSVSAGLVHNAELAVLVVPA